MLVRCLTVGPMMSNCYLVWCEETREALVIDPGADGRRILAEIRKELLEVRYIVNTHGHADHIGANREVKEATGAQLLIHAEDAPMLTSPNMNLSLYLGVPVKGPAADRLLQDGEEIAVGKGVFLRVIHTPGHTRGSICLQGEGVIFTGDTLFAGSVGRTDFPGGSYKELLASIKEKLLCYEDSYVIYPGHGPSSTLEYERKHNPFLF